MYVRRIIMEKDCGCKPGTRWYAGLDDFTAAIAAALKKEPVILSGIQKDRCPECGGLLEETVDIRWGTLELGEDSSGSPIVIDLPVISIKRDLCCATAGCTRETSCVAANDYPVEANEVSEFVENYIKNHYCSPEDSGQYVEAFFFCEHCPERWQ